MNSKTANLLLLLIISVLFLSCNSKKSEQENRVVIGIIADVQTLNALFAFSYEEFIIAEELYPGLIQTKWNKDKGEMEPFPLIAKSWVWSADSSSIKFFMRDGIYWSDGQKLTMSFLILMSRVVYTAPLIIFILNPMVISTLKKHLK